MSVVEQPELQGVADLRRLRVLVVDDDRLQLRALQRVLRGNKQIELIVVDNAIDALLAVGASKPDLVVMDVFMPGLDGIEACRRIKANADTRDTQVILASAGMTRDLERSAFDAGAKRAIAKPVDVIALLDAAIIDRHADTHTVVDVDVHAPPVVQSIRGADLMVQMLEEAGVDIVFGLPGGAISPVHDALLDSNIRTITTRHEAGAMFAAAAYARTTGKLAVVAVTSGPGVLNAMTGLATAWCDGVPVLLLVGEVPTPAHGKGVLQDGSSHGLQIVEMSRHVTKLAVEVPRSNTLPHLLRRAIVTAMSGRRGPVVMTLPLDVTTAQVVPPRTSGTMTMSAMVGPDTLDEVLMLAMDAERPLILAGSGLRTEGAAHRLRVVAERLECPVATTPKGKAVFPESHPLALGVLGLGGHLSSRRYLEAGPDVVIAIGTSLGDMATDGFSQYLQAPRALIHVDIDARQIGKSYSPSHAIVANAADFLGGLADRLGERRFARHRRTFPGGVVRHRIPSSTKPDRIAPQDVLGELQELVPADTLYTVDSGDHFLFAAHFLQLDEPDSFLVMIGLGSMGQSIGAAIGAQLAHPDRFIAAICGDGCFAMNAFEIATAVAERLPIRVLVFNDERLGMVESGHQTVYGRQPRYPTTPLDVCTVARGLGATTLRVTQPGDLRAARELLLETRGPVVIDVQIDPDVVMPKKDRVAAMAPGIVPRPPPKIVN